MARIKLSEQSSYPFSCELKVRVSELNYGNHLGYDRLIGMAHEARFEFFQNIGVKESDIGDGVGILAADLAVMYQGEAFWGQRLSFEICPIDLERGSFRLAHRVMCNRTDPVALIETGFVAFNKVLGKPVRMPAGFRKILLEMNNQRVVEESQ